MNKLYARGRSPMSVRPRAIFYSCSSFQKNYVSAKYRRLKTSKITNNYQQHNAIIIHKWHVKLFSFYHCQSSWTSFIRSYDVHFWKSLQRVKETGPLTARLRASGRVPVARLIESSDVFKLRFLRTDIVPGGFFVSWIKHVISSQIYLLNKNLIHKIISDSKI